MDRLTNQQVYDAALHDWRKLAQGLHARFHTGDFATGTSFVSAVGEAAERAGHHPEVRLAPPWVELKLVTHADGWWVTERDVDLARSISEIAARHGLRAEPRDVAQCELALDTAAPTPAGKFWAALLTGSPENVVHEDVMDPDARVPNLWFQGTGAHDTPRQRFHIDLWLPHDVAEERIAAAVAAGGTVVDDSSAPAFTVLADPEGNRACICTALGR